MMISSRGRYALRVLVDLAENGSAGGYIPLHDIAARQGISQKYLESIMAVLSKADLVDAAGGKCGGYRLNRAPEDYRAGDVLRLTEKELAPVACLGNGAQPCEHASECRTLPLWSKLYKQINDCLDSVTISELMRNENN